LGVLVAAGFSTLTIAQASAAPVSVPYLCTLNVPKLAVSYDLGIANQTVTASAPTFTTAGDAIPLTYSFGPIASGLPFAVPGSQVRAEPTIDVRQQGGPTLFSQSAVGAAGPATTIAANGPITTPPTLIAVPTSTPGGPVDFAPESTVELIPAQVVLRFVASSDPNFADANPANAATITCTRQGADVVVASSTINYSLSTLPPDRCVAQFAGTTGPPGCNSVQVVRVAVTPGNLSQRAYTSGINPGPNSIELGTITTPVKPTPVIGTLNEVVVTDHRGGTLGWSLTATLSNFVGSNPLHLMGPWNLESSPTCQPATPATAYDYDSPTTSTVPGFESTSVAPGQAAGPSSQSFASSVNLCTKDTTPNATTGSTGGIYNITSPLVLTVPGFQAADVYTAVMTVKLV